jgi:hypothetical protein
MADHMRGKSVLGLGVVLVAALAGCTSTAVGTPTAASSITTTPSEDNTYGAPRVEHPLDATPYLDNPCAVLTPTQLGTFGITNPGKPETTGPLAETAGPMCIWRNNVEPSFGFDVGFLTGNKNGLADTYRGGEEAFPGYFEPTTVDGYPAVFNDPVDSRDGGRCNLTVGINDNLTFRTSPTSTPLGRRTCDEAVKVAQAVIATLKAGG